MPRPDRSQAQARLIILMVAPVGSILFALLSLLTDGFAQGLLLVASALTGSLALGIGFVLLIVQIIRKDLNLRNTSIFSILFLLSILVFVGSCVSAIYETLP
jgi:hypothetical protein